MMPTANRRYRHALKLFTFLMVSFPIVSSAATHVVSTPAEFVNTINSLNPGDEMLLADGTYNDIGYMLMYASGSPEQPIVIRPQTPHQVTITGELRWRIFASDIIIRGLHFSGVTKVLDASRYYDDLIDSPYTSRRIRISGCRFTSCEVEFNTGGNPKGPLLNLRGNEHRIDNCFFYDPMATPIVLNGDRTLMEARIRGDIRVDNNIFRDMSRLRLVDTQGEAIFMGTGFAHYRTQPLGATIEYNVFDMANGDKHGEIITVKCSENTIRNNVFANAPGPWYSGGAHLSLRHTDRTDVHNNLFQNLGIGIWVTGRYHRIVNNYFIDMDWSGLYFPQGNIDDVVDDQALVMVDGVKIDMINDPNAYGTIASNYGAVFWAAEDCLINHNYFGDLGGRAFHSLDPSNPSTLFIAPTGHDVVNNFFDLFQIDNNMYIAQPGANFGAVGTNPVYGQPSDFAVFSGDALPMPTIGGLADNTGVVLGESESLLEMDAFKQSRDLTLANDIGAAESSSIPGSLSGDWPALPPMPGSLSGLPLNAEFKPFRSTVKTGEYLMFDAAFSAGSIDSYTWDFDDGNTAVSTTNAIAHCWDTPGSYEVTLTVKQGSDTEVFSQTITVDPPFSISISRGTGNSFEINFTGILQSSETLDGWTDITPQPTSPHIWTESAMEPVMFFRARAM